MSFGCFGFSLVWSKKETGAPMPRHVVFHDLEMRSFTLSGTRRTTTSELDLSPMFIYFSVDACMRVWSKKGTGAALILPPPRKRGEVAPAAREL